MTVRPNCVNGLGTTDHLEVCIVPTSTPVEKLTRGLVRLEGYNSEGRARAGPAKGRGAAGAWR